jgi:beta-1,3-glucuronyltransferase S
MISDQFDKEFASMVDNDTMIICKESFNDKRQFVNVQLESSTPTQTPKGDKPRIFFVTPTYLRREQVAELTRLGQTLMHVENILWIVADDSESCNSNLDKILDLFGKLNDQSPSKSYFNDLFAGLPYVHLSSPMPYLYRSHKSIPRGVSNR